MPLKLKMVIILVIILGKENIKEAELEFLQKLDEGRGTVIILKIFRRFGPNPCELWPWGL